MSVWPIALAFIVVATGDTRSLPSEIDLRASYCMVVVQHELDDLRAILKDGEMPEGVRSTFTEDLGEAAERLRRLRLYLLPRIPRLELDGMLIAQKRGHEDWKKHGDHIHQCMAPCYALPIKGGARAACEKQCMESPFQARFKVCETLTWLPY